jgi:hypothetical protein
MNTVLTLRPTLTANYRAFSAMRALMNTLDELKALAESDPVELQFYIMEIDRADTDIKLLLTRLRMKRTTSQLCSQFGKAP